MSNLNYSCALADVCTSQYWGGHYLPHVGIVVHKNMTLQEIKDGIKSEINADAVIKLDEKLHGGTNYELTEEGYEALKKAVDGIELKDGAEFAFTDIEDPSDDDDSSELVMAWFVFVEQ